MTDWGLVLDVSSSRVTREDFRRLKEGMGVRGFIQCLQTGGFSQSQADVRAVAEPNLSDADAEGLPVGGYLNSQPWRPVPVIVADAISVAGAAWSGLEMVANDMEIDGIEEAHCFATQLEIERHGKRVPAYTAWWFAGPRGGLQWPWIPARWDADYDGRPQLDPVRWGPDSAPIIGKQYAGTTNLGDDLFDLNFFDLDYLKARQEDDMSQADVDAIKAYIDSKFDPVAAQLAQLFAETVGWKAQAGDWPDITAGSPLDGADRSGEMLHRLRKLSGAATGGGPTLAQALRQIADKLEAP